MKKRIFTLLLALLMVCALTPVSIFAEDTTAACTHQHDESCGYRAPVEEVPCDQGCTGTDADGNILHAEGCSYQAGDPGAECGHVHDENCGGLASQTHVCICTEKCTAETVNEACPVCGMEGADLTACAGTAQNPEPSQLDDSEEVTAIQARIDALPTLAEYLAMSDAARDAVKETATALNGEYTALTDGQKLLVDAGKLETLLCVVSSPVIITYTDGTFDTWDGASDLEITKDCTVTVTQNYIQKDRLTFESITAVFNGGGHTVTIEESNCAFYISLNANVTMNDLYARRDVTADGPLIATYGTLEMNRISASAANSNIVKIAVSGASLTANDCTFSTESAGKPTLAAVSGAVTLNRCEVTSPGQVCMLHGSDSVLTVNNSQITQTTAYNYPVIYSQGTLYMNSGTVSNSSGSTVDCVQSYIIYMRGGEIIQASTQPNYAVKGSYIYMSGGAVTASVERPMMGIYGKKEATVTGGSVSGFTYGIRVTAAAKVQVGSGATFSDNGADLILVKDAVFTIQDDFTGTASVLCQDTIPDNTKRVITTADTDPRKLSQITSADSQFAVGYDEEGECLYLYKHVHDWIYTAEGNTVTAACTITSVPPCGLQPVLVLDAPDMAYNGEPYSLASVINGITATTGAEAGSITYWSGDTQLDTAPTEIGTYTAKITIGGETAEDTFEIFQGHTVTYIVDGEVIDTQIVKHGGDAAAPTIPAKTGYDQTPPSWDKDGKNITKDTVITAVYTINQYTVTYVADGKTVAVETVKHGQDSTAPKIPEKSGYTAQWDGDGKCITGDTTITALYTAITVTPHTGDDMPLAFWAAAMLLSLLGIGTVITTRKRCR